MADNQMKTNISGTIFDYIAPDDLRTILVWQREIPLGVSEYPIDFNLEGVSLRKLEFTMPKDGMLYGCVKKSEMSAKFGINFLIDSANVFVQNGKVFIIFIPKNKSDFKVLEVKPKELAELLNGCRRVPEQRQ